MRASRQGLHRGLSLRDFPPTASSCPAFVCDNCLLESNEDHCNTNAHIDNFGNFCDADLDNNGIVNSFDLSILRDNFGASGANDADITCDGIVNSFDLTEMRNDFGQAPGPSGL